MRGREGAAAAAAAGGDGDDTHQSNKHSSLGRH